MTRRDEEDASGEGTSWLGFRHAAAEGVGLIGNALRERGIHHRALDLARGEPVPKDLRGVGGLIVLGGPMGAYLALFGAASSNKPEYTSTELHNIPVTVSLSVQFDIVKKK